MKSGALLKVKYFNKRRGFEWVAKEVLRSDVFKVVTNIQMKSPKLAESIKE